MVVELRLVQDLRIAVAVLSLVTAAYDNNYIYSVYHLWTLKIKCCRERWGLVPRNGNKR